MSLAIKKPSFWYLAAALLLGAVAYPSVLWLPGFVEQFRDIGFGLLPAHLLFTRYMGGLIAGLSIVLFVLFILSAFQPRLHDASHFKVWGLLLAFIYTAYSLLLMASLATAG
jgi:hypothetical protein